MKKIGRRKFLYGGALFGYTLAVDATSLTEAGELSSIPVPPREPNSLSDVPLSGERVMRKADLECDVLVAGGGLAGVCAAISSARTGAKTILIQDRSRLGGNSSSEIRMHPLGVDPAKTGFREGGVIEELKLANMARNPQLSWENWDLLLYDKCISEKNIDVFLDTVLVGANSEGGRIRSVVCRCDPAFTIYEIKAKQFIDCTGDGRLAMEAGAKMMSGREGKEKFGEPRGGFDGVGLRQGSSILFSSKKCGRKSKYVPPSWAKKITPEMLKYRNINSDNLNFGYWWIELGGTWDANRDLQYIRRELLSILFGVWDYIKNSGKFPEADDRVLDFVGMIPGKRDTFRIEGERILNQFDIQGGWKNFKDSVCVGGWPLDDHPSEGFLASDRRPGSEERYDKACAVAPYNIPLSCFVAKGFRNLLMAGRDISCSHVAFGSTRVMVTCAVGGQAAGTAAALCVKKNVEPKFLCENPEELQQELLRADQTILNLRNNDPRDVVGLSKITASSSALDSRPENVATGITIDSPGSNANKWLAEADSEPWINFEFPSPQKVSSVRITFDSGARELAQSYRPPRLRKMKFGVQPELAKDYEVSAVLPSGEIFSIAKVENNEVKLAVHDFKPTEVKSVKIAIKSTNGDKYARIREVRIERPLS